MFYVHIGPKDFIYVLGTAREALAAHLDFHTCSFRALSVWRRPVPLKGTVDAQQQQPAVPLSAPRASWVQDEGAAIYIYIYTPHPSLPLTHPLSFLCSSRGSGWGQAQVIAVTYYMRKYLRTNVTEVDGKFSRGSNQNPELTAAACVCVCVWCVRACVCAVCVWCVRARARVCVRGVCVCVYACV